ncbi:MAG: hypothetical protein KI785_12050 [Devosiaceae bacterium]|nr:hypothetical protein [Devosiaceae bacterium MH13]
MTHGAPDDEQLARFRRVLEASWSLQSSSRWTADNPALGQCGVTALVANDVLGGEIAKTRLTLPGLGEIWHFYNVIGGVRIDFTESQFDAPISYDDVASDRDDAFGDTNADQYGYLKGAVDAALR